MTAALLLLAAAAFAADVPSARFEVDVLLQGRGVIWGFDFLPDGRILLTERGGALVIFDPKTKSAAEVPGAPEVRAKGQGGLLDVKLHPDFAENGWVYLAYSEPVGGGATTALGRGRLKGGKLEGFTRLFSAREPNGNVIHYGTRILFDGAHLFLTVGDRNDRHKAQDLGAHNGKVLRLTHDGRPAAGNPFEAVPGALPEIWSYGHRNPQGLALRPGTRELWSCEFGPRGGDELNLIKPGGNYGWPVVTYGREYWGPTIGEGTDKKGMEQPIAHWTPVISPSGMDFYDGNAFPSWKGSLFIGNLSSTHLRRLTLKGAAVAAQEVLLADSDWRFRQVRQGPDGFLYFSTDEGRLARLIPARD